MENVGSRKKSKEVTTQMSSSAIVQFETILGNMLTNVPTETELDKPLLRCLPGDASSLSREDS